MIARPPVRGILATAVGVLFLVHGALAASHGAATRSASPRAGVSLATTAEPDTGAKPNFSGYQMVLDDFVSVISDSGAAIETRFDYWELNHKTDRAERLARVRSALLSIPPSQMSARTRLAWAINAYNFLVLQLLTENLYDRPIHGYFHGKPAWVRQLRKSVQEISFDNGSFFDAGVVQVEGKDYSLNSFERHFLFADFDPSSKSPPPSSLDPRVHFALVCGAAGCPPLMPRAYLPDSLDRQLDRAVRNALRSPSHLIVDRKTGGIAASSIFSWYERDFGGQPGILAFLRRYAPPGARAVIEKRKARSVNSYIPWDWSLNMTLDKGS